MTAPDIAGVLAEHELWPRPVRGAFLCDCGTTIGYAGDTVDVGGGTPNAHRAHVAAAVRAEVGRWLTSDEAEASAAYGVEDYAYPGLSASECEQAARAALAALAEQLAPARGDGGGS